MTKKHWEVAESASKQWKLRESGGGNVASSYIPALGETLVVVGPAVVTTHWGVPVIARTVGLLTHPGMADLHQTEGRTSAGGSSGQYV